METCIAILLLSSLQNLIFYGRLEYEWSSSGVLILYSVSSYVLYVAPLIIASQIGISGTKELFIDITRRFGRYLETPCERRMVG